MSSRCPSHESCRELAGELRDMAGWFAGGGLTQEQFRRSVITMEARKAARFGFRLSGAGFENGRVRFTMRCADTGQLHASIDVDAFTGERTFRVVN